MPITYRLASRLGVTITSLAVLTACGMLDRDRDSRAASHETNATQAARTQTDRADATKATEKKTDERDETSAVATGSHSLSGDHEVPSNDSNASGTHRIKVTADRKVSGDVTVKNMQATVAHIHEAAAGSNGPAIVPLTKVSDNRFKVPDNATLTPEQYQNYKAGNLYVNVHSDQFPDGEVRAQLEVQ